MQILRLMRRLVLLPLLVVTSLFLVLGLVWSLAFCWLAARLTSWMSLSPSSMSSNSQGNNYSSSITGEYNSIMQTLTALKSSRSLVDNDDLTRSSLTPSIQRMNTHGLTDKKREGFGGRTPSDL